MGLDPKLTVRLCDAVSTFFSPSVGHSSKEEQAILTFQVALAQVKTADEKRDFLPFAKAMQTLDPTPCIFANKVKAIIADASVFTRRAEEARQP